jgi:hypothetical protein
MIHLRKKFIGVIRIPFKASQIESVLVRIVSGPLANKRSQSDAGAVGILKYSGVLIPAKALSDISLKLYEFGSPNLDESSFQ